MMKRLQEKLCRRKQRQITFNPPPETSSEHALSNPRSPPETDSGPSSESAPLPSFPDGVEVLHDRPDATVDICFVHGLTGDRDSTWTASGESAPWPKTLLPLELGRARILTYGYDAYVVRKSVASSNRLIDHATNLLNDLTTNRARCNASSRPLIFVAHSLGGIVCKEAILLSRNNPEPHLRGIFDCTKGIIFMGTPHKGSWKADWAKIPASAIGLIKSTNKSLLEILGTNNQLLESIQVRFLAMIREQREGGRPLEVTCFFEELPLPLAGKVVSKESATLEGYNPITIHANHRDMVRFASAEDNGFHRLLGELTRWESQVRHPSISQTEKLSGLPPSLAGYSLGDSPINNPGSGTQNLNTDCLKSLAFPEMQSRSYDINRAVTGTCEWLLQCKTYKDWAACDHGLLWIKGKPGSGKSTLLQYVLDNREARHSDLVLSFFFHGRGVELQRAPLGLFRSLLHQVLRQAPNAFPDLVETFKQRRKDIGEPGEKWDWHEQELWRFFESRLSEVLKTRSVWLFIDALDECGEKNAVDLAEKFKSLFQGFPSIDSQLHICFTCRHYPILAPYSKFEICLENENREDISTYVDVRLSVFRAQTSSTIPALITDRAFGVFMWARLVVEQVLSLDRKGVGLKKIEAEVYSIPPDLDELYHELTQGMGSASLKLIQWICFATRPLSVDELRWAMVIEADCPHQSLQECQSAEDYESDNGRMIRQIQTLSCGLAEVVPSSKTWVVQFIHQSVGDFFVEKGLSILDGSLKTADLVAGVAHYQLSRTCIRYLAMEEIVSSTTRDRASLMSIFPLLHYATASWVVHVGCSETRKHPQDDLITYFSWPSEHLVQLWVKVYSILEQHSLGRLPEGTSMLHIVSRYKLVGPLRVILQEADRVCTNIDTVDSFGRTPLSWAAENGHIAVVKLLLDKDANLNSKDNSGQTPLSWAARNGYIAVVKLLLDKGAYLNSKDNSGQTLLSWAAMAGREAVVKLLLDKGADLNSKDDSGHTPLSWATEYWQMAIVKLLLDIGADPNSKNNDGQTLLSYAVEGENEPMVRLLLDKGADPNSENNDGQMLLSYAAEVGNEAIVRLLLDKGADLDSKDNNKQTLLSYAVEGGNEAIVRLLLDKGVDPNSENNDGQTSLSYAVEVGNEAIVRLLLDKGAHLDSKNNKHTLLLCAVKVGNEAIVRLLLDKGADPNSKDEVGRAPLSYVVDYHETGDWESVVKLLVDKGANLDSKDKIGRTPLSYAVTQWLNEAVVKLLVDKGADPYSQDNKGRTPLWYMVEKSYDDGYWDNVTANLFLDKATDLEDNGWLYMLECVQCDGGSMPLSWAAKNGHTAVVKLLLDKNGVDVNSTDKNGLTALWWAAVNGHEVIMNLLLAKFEVNSDPGHLPLQIKKAKGDWCVIFNPSVPRVLDVDLVHTLPHKSIVCCVRFSQDGKYVATGCNRSAQIFDVTTGEKLCELQDEPIDVSGDLYIRSICFSPDGRYLATAAEDKLIKVWDIASRQIHNTFWGHEQNVYSLDFACDSRTIASGSGDRTVRLWDIDTSQSTLTLTTEDVVTSVALSPDASYIAAGSLGKSVRVWDLHQGYLLDHFEGRSDGHKNSVYSVTWSSNCTNLVSGSLDKAIKMWYLRIPWEIPNPEPESSRYVRTFEGHKDSIISVTPTPDATWIISCSEDRGVQFWDCRTGATQLMLQGHKNSIISVAPSPAGGYFATGSRDTRARVWSYQNI